MITPAGDSRVSCRTVRDGALVLSTFASFALLLLLRHSSGAGAAALHSAAGGAAADDPFAGQDRIAIRWEDCGIGKTTISQETRGAQFAGPKLRHSRIVPSPGSSACSGRSGFAARAFRSDRNSTLRHTSTQAGGRLRDVGHHRGRRPRVAAAGVPRAHRGRARLPHGERCAVRPAAHAAARPEHEHRRHHGERDRDASRRAAVVVAGGSSIST